MYVLTSGSSAAVSVSVSNNTEIRFNTDGVKIVVSMNTFSLPEDSLGGS